MLTQEQEKICAQIAEHYGFAQEMQAVEEMAELMQAISKFRRIRGEGQPVRGCHSDGGYTDIAQEIADVAIMMEQLRVLYGIPIEQIHGIVDYKQERMLKRINQGWLSESYKEDRYCDE